MTNPDFPLKAYTYAGHTIMFRDGKWVAVDKKGIIVASNKDEAIVKRAATNNNQ